MAMNWLSQERNSDLHGSKVSQAGLPSHASVPFMSKVIKELAKKYLAQNSSCLVFTEREISQLKLISNSQLQSDHRFTANALKWRSILRSAADSDESLNMSVLFSSCMKILNVYVSDHQTSDYLRQEQKLISEIMSLIQRVLINDMEAYDNGVLKEQEECQNLRHLVSGLFVAVSTAGDRIMELILSEPVRMAYHRKKESIIKHPDEKVNIPKSFHLITEEIMPKKSKFLKQDDSSVSEWQRIMQVLVKDIHREVKNRFRYEEYELIPCLIDWSMKVVSNSWDQSKEVFLLQPRHLLASYYSEILKAIDSQQNSREVGSLLQIFELPRHDEIYENHLNFCLRVTQSINLHKLKSLVNNQTPLVTLFIEGRELNINKNDRANEIKYILLKALSLLDFNSPEFSAKIELIIASLCKVLIDFDQRAKMGLEVTSVDGDNMSTYRENARCRTPENVSYLLIQLLKTNRLQPHYSQLIFALLTQRASVNASILTLIEELEQSRNKLSWLVTDRIIRLKLLACLNSDSADALSSLVGDFQISVVNSLITGNILMLKISLKYLKDLIQPWFSEQYNLISIVLSGLFRMILSNTKDSNDQSSTGRNSFSEIDPKRKKSNGNIQKPPEPDPFVQSDLRFIHILPIITEILDRLSPDLVAYDRIRQENLTNFMRTVLISVTEPKLTPPAQAAIDAFYIHVPPLSLSASKTYTNYILVCPASNDLSLKDNFQKPMRAELKQKYSEKSRTVDSTNFGELLYLVCVSRVLSIKVQLFNSNSRSQEQGRRPEALVAHMLEYLDNPSLYTRELDNYRAILEAIVIKNIQRYQANVRDSPCLRVKCKAHADDFVALLHFMCSINRHLASKARDLSRDVILSFPLLLLEPQVLQSGIRLLEYLDESLSSQFKSISSRLKFGSISTLLPVNVKDIQESIVWIASSLLRLFFLNLLTPNDSLKMIVRQIAIDYFSSDSKNPDSSGIGSGFVNFMLMMRISPGDLPQTGSMAQILTDSYHYFEKVKPESIMQKNKNPIMLELLIENPKFDFELVKSNFATGLPLESTKIAPSGFPVPRISSPSHQPFSKALKGPDNSRMIGSVLDEISHAVQIINFIETILKSEDLFEKLLEQPASKDALLRVDPLLRGTIHSRDQMQNVDEAILLMGQEKKRDLLSQILFLFQLIDSKNNDFSGNEALGRLQCILSRLTQPNIWKEILHKIFLNANIQHRISLESLVSFVLESIRSTLDVMGTSAMHSSFSEESMLTIRSSLFTAGYNESWISTCLSLFGKLCSDPRPCNLTPQHIKSLEKILFYQLSFYSDLLPTLNVNAEENLSHFSQLFSILKSLPVKVIPMLSLRNASILVNTTLEALYLHHWAKLPTSKLERFVVLLVLHRDSAFNKGLFKKNLYSQKNKRQIEFCLKFMTRNYNLIQQTFPSLNYKISKKVYGTMLKKDEGTRCLERVLQKSLALSKSRLFRDPFEWKIKKGKLPGIAPIEANSVDMRSEVLLMLGGEIENLKALFLKEFGNYPSPLQIDSLIFSENDRDKMCQRLVTVSPMVLQNFYSKFQHAFPKTYTKSTWGTSLVIDSLSQVVTQWNLLDWNFDAIIKTEAFKTSQIFYCNPPSISILLQYTGPDYSDNEFALDYVTKTLQRLTSRQLAFYLTEVYQSLSGRKYIQFANILHKFANTSPLVYHQLIWMAKVESKRDPAERVTPGTIQKCEVSVKFFMKLYKSLSAQDREYFFLEDNFIEQITAISGMLKPKMESGEKFRIIRKELERIVIPPGVYLPTNPFFQVVKIRTDSGTPMQSAARCPIKVAFDCKRFEGPDKYLDRIKNMRASFHVNEKETDLAIDDDEMDHKGVNNVKEMICKSMTYAKANSLRMSSKSNLDDHQPFLKPSGSSENPFYINHGYINFDELVQPDFSNNSQMLINNHKGGRQREGYKGSTIINAKKVFTQSEHESIPGGSEGVFGAQVLEKASLIQSNIRKEWNEEKVEKEKQQVVDCIFKVHDDIRQDSLALQIIHLFHDIFQQVGLDLYLFPYRTISNRTGHDMDIGGLIEVVPNTNSRDQIGKLNEYSLYDYFISKFGSESTPFFQQARGNFIKSMAAYSVVSYILQIKDRHNGNILIGKHGHIIHIDFGFIFDISPAGNMKFEKAEFKLTEEMIKIMGGDKNAEPFMHFIDQTIKAFLAVRDHAEEIYNLIYLMSFSGMKCYKPPSMQNLRNRFMLRKSKLGAAKEMIKIINTAFDNWRTNVYDKIQFVQQKIAY